MKTSLNGRWEGKYLNPDVVSLSKRQLSQKAINLKKSLLSKSHKFVSILKQKVLINVTLQVYERNMASLQRDTVDSSKKKIKISSKIKRCYCRNTPKLEKYIFALEKRF